MTDRILTDEELQAFEAHYPWRGSQSTEEISAAIRTYNKCIAELQLTKRKLEGLLEVVADVVTRGSHALMNPQVLKNLSDALKQVEGS